MQTIGAIMFVAALVLQFLFGHRFGPRGGEHDPRIEIGPTGLWDVLNLAMFVVGCFLCMG